MTRGSGSGPGRYVALLRGVNVGRAKRIAMADLKAAVEGLGYRDVRTLLNSGNLVFSADDDASKIGSRIENAVTQLGVTSRVTVLSADEISRIVAGNTLVDLAENPSRLIVAVPSLASDRKRLLPMLKMDWSPEALALGPRAAYLWCPQGVLESPLGVALGKLLGAEVTSRNWTTISKLDALAQSD